MARACCAPIPASPLVVVLSLALGIGANSALFSVANALLFRALPVPQPEQLHMVRFQSRLPDRAALLVSVLRTTARRAFRRRTAWRR